MKFSNQIWAFIPARSRSKIIKNKNKLSSLRLVSKMCNPSHKTMRIVNKKLCFLFNKEFEMDKFDIKYKLI